MTETEEKAKKATFEELQFKKTWAKLLKLSPIEKNLSRNVGRAPKHSVKVKEINISVDTKGKKKK